MKQIILPAMLLLSSSLFSGIVFGQQKQEKKIIITDNDGKINTIIEGDTLALNGKLINPDDIASIQVIPSPDMKFDNYMNQYLKEYFSDKAVLGVSLKQADNGAEVIDVTKDSPAEKAGILKGDVITKVNDENIDGPEKLVKVIGDMKPGTTVNIELLRDGKKKEVRAELSKRSEDLFEGRSFTFPRPDGNIIQGRNFNGEIRNPQITVRGFGVTRKPSMGLKVQDTENETGVTVLNVAPNSAAEKAGVKEGDLITAINGEKVKDVPGVLAQIEKSEGNDYKLQITRNKKPLTITVKIPKTLRKANL